MKMISHSEVFQGSRRLLLVLACPSVLPRGLGGLEERLEGLGGLREGSWTLGLV